MDWILTHSVELINIVLGTLGVFSILAKLTPTDADNKILDAVYKFINMLGLTKK